MGVGILWGVLGGVLAAGPSVPPRPTTRPADTPRPATTRPGTAANWQTWTHPKGWVSIDYPRRWRVTPARAGASQNDAGGFFEIGFVPPGQPASLSTARQMIQVMVLDRDSPASPRQAENYLVAQLRDGAPDFAIRVIGPLSTARLEYKLFAGEGQIMGRQQVATLACAAYRRGVILVVACAPPGQIEQVGPSMRAMLSRIRLRPDLYPSTAPRSTFFVDAQRRFCLSVPETWTHTTPAGDVPAQNVHRWVGLNDELAARLEIAPGSLTRQSLLDVKVQSLANRFKTFGQGVGVLSGRTSVVVRAAAPDRGLVYEQVTHGGVIYGVQTSAPLHPTPAEQRALEQIRESLYLGYSPAPGDFPLPPSRAVYIEPPARGPTRRSLIGVVRQAEMMASLVLARPVRLSDEQVDRFCTESLRIAARMGLGQRTALAQGDREFRQIWERWQRAATDRKLSLAKAWRARLGWLAHGKPADTFKARTPAEQLLLMLHAHWLQSGTGPWSVQTQPGGPGGPTSRPAGPAPEYFPRLRPARPGWQRQRRTP